MNTTNISCPKCQSTNRLPSDRLKDKPTCGKCKSILFLGKPQELTSANVAVVLNHNQIPVIVDCWAPWCGPCKSFGPVFEQTAKELESRFRFAKLNTEEQTQLATRWQIRSIPTLILFKHAKETTRISGALSQSQLKQWLTENS